MDLSDRPCFSVSIRHGKSHCDNSKIAIETKSEISTAEDDIYEMSDCVSLHKRHQRLQLLPYEGLKGLSHVTKGDFNDNPS